MQIHLKDGKSTWKQEWAEIGGKRNFYRSRWEYRYALYLEFMKKHKHIVEWEHEPKTFYFEGIKRGTNNYKPDFRVIFPSGNEEWIEVKGYETSKDRTKYKRMAKYHPDVKLRVIGKEWFKENGSKLKNIISGW
jgi:hypothetical protein